MIDREPCGVCGGDGRIDTAHQSTACPACHGSGRRGDRVGFHDVTKTKPSHHEPEAVKGAKKIWPATALGHTLAEEVKATSLGDDVKARLTQSIIDYEDRKGQVTKTFSRLLRKQLRELIA
ncbi:MAG: molecular chaperone DnaJ [Polyangiaceae bacterium]